MPQAQDKQQRPVQVAETPVQTAPQTQAITEPSVNYKGMKFAARSIYLDAGATTPVDPRVLDAMLPYFTQQYGNPHSRTHLYGWETDEAIEQARQHVADLIGADSKEIVFTSGATESNNAIIKGIARFNKGRKKHIVTTQVDHKCVLDTCRALSTEGFEVTYLSVGKDGLVDLKEFEAALREDTVLASVIAVNNEIGGVQPLKELGEICRKRKIFFHTDAAQAVGKIPLNVHDMNIDAMSISGHKIYGPKGVGAMYVGRRPRVRLEPLMSGGGQERGMRSGTLPPALVVGLGEAARVSKEELEADHAYVSKLSKRLIEGIRAQLPEVHLNGHPEKRYPGNVNFSFAFVEGESLLMGLKDIAVSSGSACTSATLEPSYVLRAVGVGEDLAHTSIRFGISRFTTEAEIDATIKLVVDNVNRLREMSPLYEMFKEGIDPNSIQWTS